jgi:hypothetical protein
MFRKSLIFDVQTWITNINNRKFIFLAKNKELTITDKYVTKQNIALNDHSGMRMGR